MKRMLILLLAVVLALGGCRTPAAAAKKNTISTLELTGREKLLLEGMSEKAFAFEYQVDDTFETVELNLETYRDGKSEGGQSSSSPIPFENGKKRAEGMIVFTADSIRVRGEDEKESWTIFRVLNSGSGGGSRSVVPIPDYPAAEAMSSIWSAGGVEGRMVNRPLEPGKPIVLASICFSSGNGISSLTRDFYEDPGAHMDELEQYDAAYLLWATFHPKEG